MYLSVKSKDYIYKGILISLIGSLSISILLIFIFLLSESNSLISTSLISDYLLKSDWYPSDGDFGLLPMILATIYTSVGAVLIGTPLGLFCAINLYFFTSKNISFLIQRMLELYTAIPSVVFGLWGLTKLVPFLQQFQPQGQSLLAGILLLSLMIFPIITVSALAAFKQYDEKYKISSKSIPLKLDTYILKVILPSSKSQLTKGFVLQFGRALGETMALLMVCGNIPNIPSSITDPVRTLTSNMALEMAYAMDEHRASLYVSALFLFLTVTLLLLLIRKEKN